MACHSPTSFLKSSTFTMVSAAGKERNRNRASQTSTSENQRETADRSRTAALFRGLINKSKCVYYLLCMSRTVWWPGSAWASLSSSPSRRGRCRPYTSYTGQTETEAEWRGGLFPRAWRSSIHKNVGTEKFHVCFFQARTRAKVEAPKTAVPRTTTSPPQTFFSIFYLQTVFTWSIYETQNIHVHVSVF